MRGFETKLTKGNKWKPRKTRHTMGKQTNPGTSDKLVEIKKNQGNPEEKQGNPERLNPWGKPVKSRETWGKQEKSLN